MNSSKPQYLLPHQPKLDKLAALYLYTRFLAQTTLDGVEVRFYDGSVPTDVFIDVDALPGRDYKAQGAGSATEVVVRNHPELLTIVGMNYFVDLFNFNNKTGRLKNKFGDNCFNLINDWPRAGHSCSKSEHMLRIMRDLWPVFDLYFATAAKVGNDRIVYVRNPFCLDGIDRMLDLLKPKPESLERYVTMVDRLEECFEATAKADQRTLQTARTMKPEYTFTVSTPEGEPSEANGAIYRTNDTRLVRHLWAVNPKLRVIVVRDRTGNTAIFFRGRQDLTALYAALEQRDPDGRWHLETRYKSPFIANGSESRDVFPTRVGPTELMKLVRDNVVSVSRTQATTA